MRTFISHIRAHNFSISSNGCTLTFQSDSIINWEKAIFYYAASITDYKHATMTMIVDGSYKTAIQITSTCDIFYCDGEKPNTVPVRSWQLIVRELQPRYTVATSWNTMAWSSAIRLLKKNA